MKKVIAILSMVFYLLRISVAPQNQQKLSGVN